MAVAALVHKLIARAAGRDAVRPGESVRVRVDRVVLDDAGGAESLARVLHAVMQSPEARARTVLVVDHHLGANDEAFRVRYLLRSLDASQLTVYDGLGLADRVVPRHGHLGAGTVAVGRDGHMGAAGALGALVFGVDPGTLRAAALSGGIELVVPPAVFLRWSGLLADGVAAADMALAMRGRFGARGLGGSVVELCGEAVQSLAMDERMSLARMARLVGARAGLLAVDALAQAWLKAAGADAEAAESCCSDEDAPGARHFFDASVLAPQVALPGGADDVRSVDAVDPVPVQVAVLGGCAGAKLDDLHAAARVLAGYHIADGVRLLVTPASLHDAAEAERLGIWRLLREAGATLLPSLCGTCGHPSLEPAPGETAVVSAPCLARGPRTLLASPYTVAASALAGRIADPRAALA